MSETVFHRSDIRSFVEPFYDAVRRDEMLGPIFAAKIGDTDEEWAPHLLKIENFWANVLMKERSYRGNPMLVHQGIPNIQAQHFDRWLMLFNDVVSAELPVEKAQIVSEAAKRIGRSLAMGLERRGGGPPGLLG